MQSYFKIFYKWGYLLMNLQFGLIGHPVFHSISPFIHERLFKLSKISAEYHLFDISPNNLTNSVNFLKKLDGYNVTIPYKQKIIPFLNNLCDKAKLYKCVNTVKNGSFSSGFNTDANGFLSALAFEKISLSGDVVILGCGGAARIFCFESVLRNCDVTLAVRNQSISHAKILVNDVKSATGKIVSVTSIDNLPQNIDLLINATPVGMFPNVTQMPVSDAYLKNCTAVFDAIYNPIETLLIKKARSNGAKVASGMSMLVFQAVFAHKIWTDATFSHSDIFQLILDSKENLKKFG